MDEHGKINVRSLLDIAVTDFVVRPNPVYQSGKEQP